MPIVVMVSKRSDSKRPSAWPTARNQEKPMRFMIIVKATAGSEAGIMPSDTLMVAMADFNAQLARAGLLLDAAGLQPSRKGWRVRYENGRREVIDGPFADTKELVAGYTLIQTRSREEAQEWARRFPSPHGEFESGEIEVRQLYEPEDFPKNQAAEHL
jgi:hypothetical protein